MNRLNKLPFNGDSLIKYLPNAITITNMVLGLAVISLVIENNSKEIVKVCCLLILLGAILDGLDGKLARYLNATNDLGKELDSFADLITFGLAPVCLLWQLDIFVSTPLSFLLLSIYPLAGAFRLARYNIGNYQDYFLGVPITVAGAFMALYILFYELFLRGSDVQIFGGITVIVLLVLSLLMTSSIKVPRLSLSYRLGQNAPFSIRIK